MSRPKEKINFEVTRTEKNFLEFCRRENFIELKLVVMNGEPVKALEPIRSRRFDLSTDEPLDGPGFRSL